MTFALKSVDTPMDEERRAAFDVDYTPRAIPRQVYELLAPEVEPVRRILCPAAGAGSWAAEARARWPEAHITAVEIRPEERVHLRRWCNVVAIGDIRAAAAGLTGNYDLIADNPPFSLWPLSGGRKSQAETLRAFVVDLRPLLARGGRLCLYHQSDMGQRSRVGRAILAEHNPLYQLRHQPVQHRAKPGVDQKSYSTWVWGREDGGGLKTGWVAWDMPELTAAERKWITVPGTEME